MTLPLIHKRYFACCITENIHSASPQKSDPTQRIKLHICTESNTTPKNQHHKKKIKLPRVRIVLPQEKSAIPQVKTAHLQMPASLLWTREGHPAKTKHPGRHHTRGVWQGGPPKSLCHPMLVLPKRQVTTFVGHSVPSTSNSSDQRQLTAPALELQRRATSDSSLRQHSHTFP